MEPWNHRTMEPLNHGIMEPRNHGIMEPWNHGTMEPRNHGIMDHIHIIQTFIHRDRSYKYFHPLIKTTILITMYMLPSIHHCIHIRITYLFEFLYTSLSNILMNAMFPCCTCDVAWDTNERYSMRSKMCFERGSCPWSWTAWKRHQSQGDVRGRMYYS